MNVILKIVGLLIISLTACFQSMAQKQISMDSISSYSEIIKKEVTYVNTAFEKFTESTKKKDELRVEEALRDYKSASKYALEHLENLEPLSNESWYLPAAIKWMEQAVDIGLNEFMEAKIYYSDPYSASKREALGRKIVYKMGEANKKLEMGEIYLIAKLYFKPLNANFCYASEILVNEANNNFSQLRGALMRGETNKFEVSDKPEGAIKGEILVNENDTSARYLYHRGSDINLAREMYDRLVFSVVSCTDESTEPRILKVGENDLKPGNYPVFKLLPRYGVNKSHFTIKVTLVHEDENRTPKQWLVFLEYLNSIDY